MVRRIGVFLVVEFLAFGVLAQSGTEVPHLLGFILRPAITVACADDLNARGDALKFEELSCEGKTQEEREHLLIEKAMSFFPGDLEPLLMAKFDGEKKLHSLSMFIVPGSSLRGRYRLACWMSDHVDTEQLKYAQQILKRAEKGSCQTTHIRGWPYEAPRLRFFHYFCPQDREI